MKSLIDSKNYSSKRINRKFHRMMKPNNYTTYSEVLGTHFKTQMPDMTKTRQELETEYQYNKGTVSSKTSQRLLELRDQLNHENDEKFHGKRLMEFISLILNVKNDKNINLNENTLNVLKTQINKQLNHNKTEALKKIKQQLMNEKGSVKTSKIHEVSRIVKELIESNEKLIKLNEQLYTEFAKQNLNNYKKRIERRIKQSIQNQPTQDEIAAAYGRT
tara:strand:- start:335 stop:988 length:654 start_codon:yes stop_codon:yes gene_type:complete